MTESLPRNNKNMAVNENIIIWKDKIRKIKHKYPCKIFKNLIMQTQILLSLIMFSTNYHLKHSKMVFTKLCTFRIKGKEKNE